MGVRLAVEQPAWRGSKGVCVTDRVALGSGGEVDGI